MSDLQYPPDPTTTALIPASAPTQGQMLIGNSAGTAFTSVDNIENIYQVFDGITVNAVREWICPYPTATITGVTLLVPASGVASTTTVDILKSTSLASYPSVLTSITASATPAITAGIAAYTDTTLTGWTKTLVAGNILVCKVTAINVLTHVTLIFTVKRLS